MRGARFVLSSGFISKRVQVRMSIGSIDGAMLAAAGGPSRLYNDIAATHGAEWGMAGVAGGRLELIMFLPPSPAAPARNLLAKNVPRITDNAAALNIATRENMYATSAGEFCVRAVAVSGGFSQQWD